MRDIECLEIDPDFEIERDFDHLTMYCYADISDLTGWNCQIIDEQVRLGHFPKPLNPGSRAVVWERWRVDMHYRAMIAQEPDEEERSKIERYRDIYDQAYRDALEYPVFTREQMEAEARAHANKKVKKYNYYDDDDAEEAWLHFYEEAYEGDELIEQALRWKARQAVRFHV